MQYLITVLKHKVTADKKDKQQKLKKTSWCRLCRVYLTTHPK